MKLLFFGMIIFILSCGPKVPDREQLTHEIYELRVKELFQERDSKCKAEAYKNAELHVDKLVDTWINSSIHDTIEFPMKPLKPIAPEHILGKVSRFDPDTLN